MKTYEVVRQEAEALSKEQLRSMKSNLELVRVNALRGVASIDKREDDLKAIFKKYQSPSPKMLTLLEALAEAILSTSLERKRPLEQGTRLKARAVYADRDVLLGQLVTWGKLGLVPANAVAVIKEGKGYIDAAKDVIAIVDITRSFPATRTMMVHTREELEQMVARAKAFLAVVKPTGSRSTNDALIAASETVSRVYTLVCRQHEELWRLGALLYGRDVDFYVPALGSREVTRAHAAREDASPEPG